MTYRDDKSLHQQLAFLRVDGIAATVGLLQLCAELGARGILPASSVARIKDAIAREIAVGLPRSYCASDERSVRERLDRLFDTNCLVADQPCRHEPQP